MSVCQERQMVKGAKVTLYINPTALRRNVNLLSLRLGWPTAPPLHGSTWMTLKPHLELLITHHPVRMPDRRLHRILLHEKITPTPLAAAVVSAPSRCFEFSVGVEYPRRENRAIRLARPAT